MRLAVSIAAGVLIFGGGVTAAFATLARDSIFHRASTVPAGNLITNPGAEAGDGSTIAPDGSVVPIPGWETTSSFTAIQYGVGELPSTAVSAEIGGGTNFFGGGPSNHDSSASQLIDVSDAASEIDTGEANATLSAHMGGRLAEGDKGPVDAIFLDADGAELGRVTLAEVRPMERARLTILIPRTTTGDVPIGTRSVRVVMTAVVTQGGSNDTYFDNLSLTLDAPEAPPPAARFVLDSKWRWSRRSMRCRAPLSSSRRGRTG